jgi:TolA-binding protein
MSDAKKLAAFVTQRLSQERVDTQWERIATRAPKLGAARERRTTRWVAASFAVALGVALLFLGVRRAPHAELGIARSVVRSDDAPVDVSLGDGSRVELSPSSEMALLPGRADAIALELSAGSALLSVDDHDGRVLRMRSGPFEVVSKQGSVRVTRALSAEGERFRVDVEDGAVDVLRTDEGKGPVHLVAGEHWSAFAAYASAESSREVGLPQARELSPEGAQVEAPEDGAEGRDGRTRERRARMQHRQAAVLFEDANLERRAGQLREAADLYAQIVEHFPRDRRAALAAFELGRIRMDALSDPRGAVQALERALALDARRAYAEDALARLTLAHEALGDREGCRRAQEQYLARYPEGVHAARIEKRCKP